MSILFIIGVLVGFIFFAKDQFYIARKWKEQQEECVTHSGS